MTLRASKPEDIQRRLKLLLYGEAGVGKTTAACQMPRPYFIDTEGGTLHYGDLIEASDGAVFATNSLDDVEQEVLALMTEEHGFRTVVIDSFTTLYETVLEKGEKEVGNEFGRHYAFANKQCKRLFNMLSMIDLNVVVSAHSKPLYGDDMKVIGTAPDAWKKLPYLFDLVVELKKRGKKRVGVVQKTRLSEFPDLETFDWSFDELADRYGAEDLGRAAKVIVLASKDQVDLLTMMIAATQTKESVCQKWLASAGVNAWADMPSDKIQKCIDHLESKGDLVAATLS